MCLKRFFITEQKNKTMMAMTHVILNIVIVLLAIVGAVTTIKAIANAIIWVQEYKDTIEAYAKLRQVNEED